jgi:hypothetical protein
LLFIFFLLTSACAQQDPGLATRPDDFSLTYKWQEGSLPPPYHYEYTITVSSAGQGTIVMVPDYPADGVPVWSETFTVEATQMDAFYQLVLTNELFENSWQQKTDPPVGGSSQSVVITAHSQEITIPTYVIESQQEAANRIHSAIEALVPESIWAQLNAQREQYIQENQ